MFYYTTSDKLYHTVELQIYLVDAVSKLNNSSSMPKHDRSKNVLL